MRYSTFVYSCLTTTLMVVSLTGCTNPQSSEQRPEPTASEAIAEETSAALSRWEGDPQPLGDGTARAYIDLDEQNQPAAMGVILTADALENLPQSTQDVLLPLPEQADSTVVDHIELNWRSHGHDPMPIYGQSHFDVHFYTITPEEREVITAAGADLEKAYKTPAAELIPAGYIMAPDSAEPGMGAHWVDPTAEEFQGDPHGFSQSLIYGFYDGEMAFIEPMVTIDFLKSHPNHEDTIALPAQYTKAGSYPTAYRITYDEASEEYTIALDGFDSNLPQP